MHDWLIEKETTVTNPAKFFRRLLLSTLSSLGTTEKRCWRWHFLHVFIAHVHIAMVKKKKKIDWLVSTNPSPGINIHSSWWRASPATVSFIFRSLKVSILTGFKLELDWRQHRIKLFIYKSHTSSRTVELESMINQCGFFRYRLLEIKERTLLDYFHVLLLYPSTPLTLLDTFS